MAGQQIKMDPEQLSTRAKQYGQSGDQIEDMLRDLNTMKEEMATEWTGAAYDGFADQFEDMKPHVLKFAQLMHDVQEQLEKTADALKQQDEALKSGFGLK